MASTLKGNRGKKGGCTVDVEQTHVAFALNARPGYRDGDADTTYVAAALTKGSATGDGVNQPGRRQEDDVNLVSFGLNTNRGSNDDMCVEEELAPPVTGSHGHPGGVMQVQAFAWQQGDDSKHGQDGRGRSWITRAGDYTGALSKTRHDAVAGEAVGVRRLTPTECERLQGLPDGWTQLGGTPDSRRYSALGDAVTATVAEWIGRRLAA